MTSARVPGTVLGTWSAGEPVTTDHGAWSVAVAEFLGCGFRVAVPRGGGLAALDAARGRAEELACLLGATFDPAPWVAAAEEVGDGAPLLLEGGWESVFRGPLGPPLTRVVLGEGPGPEREAVAVELPWRAGVGPLASLPLISTHEQRAALEHLGTEHPDQSCVGLWRTPDGRLVDTTAGSVLARDEDGRWLHPEPGAGVVESWLSNRIHEELAARPAPLDGLPTTLVAVDVWGTVSALSTQGAADLSARAQVRAAVSSTLGT